MSSIRLFPFYLDYLTNALAVIRKQRVPAQKIVVLLIQLVHNELIWARQWLAKSAPRLRQYGIVRLIQEVWAIP